MPRISEADGPALLNKWKEIVNQQIATGRDVNVLKNLLNTCSSIQIVLGMYEYRDNGNISVPMFANRKDDWLELDDDIAKIELACCINNVTPAQYYIWQDLKDDQSAAAHRQVIEAWTWLKNWANRYL